MFRPAKEHAHGSIGKPLGLRSGMVADHSPFLFRVWPIGVPPEAQIQGELRVDPPVILRVDSVHHAVHILKLPAALQEFGSMAEHEIYQVVAGQLVGEIKFSRHREGVDEVVLQAHHVAAKMQLVWAALERRVLVDCPIASIEVPQMVRADAEVSGSAE